MRRNDYVADFQEYSGAMKHRYDFPISGSEDGEEMHAEPGDIQMIESDSDEENALIVDGGLWGREERDGSTISTQISGIYHPIQTCTCGR